VGTCNSRQDAGHVKDFSIEIGQVAHDENEDGFNDANVIGESSYQSGEETPDDSDQSTAQRHDCERSNPSQNVSILDVFCSHSDVGVKHVVQHLNQYLIKR